MGRTIIALLRAPFELLRIAVRFVIPPKTGEAQRVAASAEEERLDRIRNPHKYGPGREG